MKHLANQQEMLLASNKSLAEFNLGLEPKLSQVFDHSLYCVQYFPGISDYLPSLSISRVLTSIFFTKDLRVAKP